MTDAETSIVHTGDCLDVLDEMPESSVHMCMTSPPYYGLRDYSVDGQFGLEDTLDEYINHLVETGRALRRVLRDDGSWWLNLGDSYAGSGTGQDESSVKESRAAPDDKPTTSFQRKQKMLVPHRVAITLQSDGWVVRNDVTWTKPNPMPHPAKDRLNTTTEQVFHLTPEPDYWYDLDAIREAHKTTRPSAPRESYAEDADAKEPGNVNHAKGADDRMHPNPAGKNPGDVFEVTTKPFPDAHFAVYPPELCEKPIKASCPPTVCVGCGAPYERDVDREPGEYDYSERGEAVGNGQQASGTQLEPPSATLRGWSSSCDCATDATEPGICLDPFAGAGTTLLKAKELGRRFVGVELNAEYADMARARVGLSPEDPSNVRDDDAQTGLEAYDD